MLLLSIGRFLPRALPAILPRADISMVGIFGTFGDASARERKGAGDTVEFRLGVQHAHISMADESHAMRLLHRCGVRAWIR